MLSEWDKNSKGDMELHGCAQLVASINCNGWLG